MLSAALTRALTTPAFIAADFVPTHWDSAEQKAKFANALLDVRSPGLSAVEVS